MRMCLSHYSISTEPDFNRNVILIEIDQKPLAVYGHESALGTKPPHHLVFGKVIDVIRITKQFDNLFPRFPNKLVMPHQVINHPQSYRIMSPVRIRALPLRRIKIDFVYRGGFHDHEDEDRQVRSIHGPRH